MLPLVWMLQVPEAGSVEHVRQKPVHVMQVDERLGAVQDLEARLKQSQEMADLFTNRERIFDLPPSPFPALAGTSHPSHHVILFSVCLFAL